MNVLGNGLVIMHCHAEAHSDRCHSDYMTFVVY